MPRAGASRTEQSGTKVANRIGASGGSRRTAPDRPGQNTKEEVIRCQPLNHNQAHRAEAPGVDQRRRRTSNKMGTCGEGRVEALDCAGLSRTCQGGGITTADGRIMGQGSGTVRRVQGPGAMTAVDLRPRTGTSGAGGGDRKPAPGAGAPGGGRRTAPDWILWDGMKRRRRQRTRHSSQRGQEARMEQRERFHSGSGDASRGIGAKKRGKKARIPKQQGPGNSRAGRRLPPTRGPSRKQRTDATDWPVVG